MANVQHNYISMSGGNIHMMWSTTPYSKLFGNDAMVARVGTVLGENNSRTFKYLFQTYSGDVLPRDVRVFNVFGII